ncbi:MAG: hypothetical protein KC431_31445, partial [Myxococcales bacterium]|nr:hypothetical protein [Myxococcales bacterium]
DLYPGCVVELEGHRPASIPRSSCERLSEDLLFDDPLRFWLERARSLELRAAGQDAVFLRREREQFVDDDGKPIDADSPIGKAMQGWLDWRSAGLRSGEPEGPVRWTLDIRRDAGQRVQVEIGDDWVRVGDGGWVYLRREPGDEPGAPDDEGPSEDFDPGALELD